MKFEVNRTIEERLDQIEKDLKQIKLLCTNFFSTFASADRVEQPLLNVKDISSLLKIDSSVIYSACNKGEIPFFKIGKLYKFKKEDIVKWLETNRHRDIVNVDQYVNSYLQKHSLKG